MNEEMLKNLILCAGAVMLIALVVVLALLLIRRFLENRNAQPEAPAQPTDQVEAKPFAVEAEITFLHSQDRLDAEDL